MNEGINLPNDDGDADREDAAFERADRRHRERLIAKRHALANKATVARLQADEMFLEIKRMDAEIEELKRGI